MEKRLRYFSMFSGIAGFELGIQNAVGDKAECVGYSEINHSAIKIYEKKFPTHRNFGDSTNFVTSNIPDFDLLVAGFPCQPFSIAGKRQGFQDTRGTHFFDLSRVLSDKRPRYFLFENVRGLLSHGDGETFQTILRTLTDIGYVLQWEVLNSFNFGVPQSRERVYIVGHLGTESRPEIFPIGKNDTVFEKKNESGGRQLQAEYSTTLGTKIRSDCTFIHNVYGGFGEKKVREFKDYSPTIRTPKGGGHLPLVKISMLAHTKANIKQRTQNRKTTWTLDTAPQSKMAVHDGDVIRSLTPIECERLQGFPDNWTRGVRDRKRYECLGNAVTSNVVELIIRKLFKHLEVI